MIKGYVSNGAKVIGASSDVIDYNYDGTGVIYGLQNPPTNGWDLLIAEDATHIVIDKTTGKASLFSDPSIIWAKSAVALNQVEYEKGYPKIKLTCCAEGIYIIGDPGNHVLGYTGTRLTEIDPKVTIGIETLNGVSANVDVIYVYGRAGSRPCRLRVYYDVASSTFKITLDLDAAVGNTLSLPINGWTDLSNLNGGTIGGFSSLGTPVIDDSKLKSEASADQINFVLNGKNFIVR